MEASAFKGFANDLAFELNLKFPSSLPINKSRMIHSPNQPTHRRRRVEMRKIQALVVVLSLLFAGVVFAAEKATPAEAEALVKKAIAYVEANGKDKAFAEFDNPNGQFVKGDLYLYVYDMNGKCLAHGANKQMIGLNLIGAKDPDGKQFISELVEMTKTNGKGWVDFKFMNPVTKQVQAKSGYAEKYKDIMIGSGVYK